MWAGSGFRVVLRRSSLYVLENQAFDRAVVEVHVAQLGSAEVRLPAHRLVRLYSPFSVWALYREAVVLARDVDPAGGKVLDGVVGSAVAEGELEGVETDGSAEELVAHAD